jgi:hypothetical protein
VIALQVNSTRGAVSSLNPPVVAPVGSADTITNSLAPFPNSGVRGGVYAAASTGNIPDYNEASCLGAGIQPDAQGYAQAIVGAGLKGVPVVGNLLSSVVGVFGAHHAAAVKQEQSILCANVPAIQAFLRSIDVAVSQGADTGAATQAMEAAYSMFVARTQPIFKNCNAACDYRKYVRAAIEYRKLGYSLRTVAQESASQGVLGGVVDVVNSAAASVSSAFTGATPYAPLPISAGQPVPVAGLPTVAGGGDYSPVPSSAGIVVSANGSPVLQAAVSPAPQGLVGVVLLVGGLLVLLKLLGR